VVQILDDSIGCPDVGTAEPRALWRGLTRDDFVAKRVFNRVVVVLGDGASSNLSRPSRGTSGSATISTMRRLRRICLVQLKIATDAPRLQGFAT
jgi:hypothetical protein